MAASSSDTTDQTALTNVLQQLMQRGGLPITLLQQVPVPVDTAARLSGKARVSVPFPPCADVLLGLIRTTDVRQEDKDDVTLFFDHYFKFGREPVLFMAPELDKALMGCVREIWPPEGCVESPCLRLDGNRNPSPLPAAPPSLRRLFLGDVAWLFFIERMGIFRLLGAILDDFAFRGRLPISNGAIDPGVRDDMAAVILELMVQHTKSGISTSVRDRESTYRRCLGWTSEAGRKLNPDAQVNTSVGELMDKFTFQAAGYYKTKQLADAIRSTATPSPPSVATLIAIGSTVEVLKKRFEVFDYGRNFHHTLSGIVWAIGAMSLVRELRFTLGIPPAFDKPHEYLSAAYDVLVAKQPVTGKDSNRFLLHKTCAEHARDILLDMEVVNERDQTQGGELERWLYQIESKVEGYRTAYQELTKIDLGASATAAAEQRV
jgi:hypothetical protein